MTITLANVDSTTSTHVSTPTGVSGRSAAWRKTGTQSNPSTL